MTFAVGILNIPPDILNISPTSSTSPRLAIALPAETSPKADVEDVEDVEPKKNSRSTYLLSVVIRGSFPRRSAMAGDAPSSTRTYLGLNILNIPNTWCAQSLRVPMARALDRLRRQKPFTLTRTRKEPS